MKKFWKVFLSVVVILGGIALAICYMAIPERTKYAMDIVIKYLNTPLGIAGGTIITFGTVVGIILHYIATRFLNEDKKELARYKEEVERLKDSAKDYEKLAEQHYQELEQKIESVCSETQKLTDELIKVCETTPNAKVKKIANEIKEVLDYGREERINDKTTKE